MPKGVMKNESLTVFFKVKCSFSKEQCFNCPLILYLIEIRTIITSSKYFGFTN